MHSLRIVFILCAFWLGLGGVITANMKSMKIPIVKNREQAPVVDGKMMGSEYKYCLKLRGLVTNEGPMAQRQADVYYVSDGEALYIGMYAKSVPEGTVPEVSPHFKYDGRNYMDFSNNDRMEIKFIPPNKNKVGATYFVGDAAGHKFIQRIKSNYDPIFPEWTYKSSFDGKGWTAEMRIPLKSLGQEALNDQAWGMNFNLARLFPLKYEGLVAGPHKSGETFFVNDLPAVQIHKIGALPKGELDLNISVREYEGLINTPKETAYDERTVSSGGLNLEKSGKVARVRYEWLGKNGATMKSESKVLELGYGSAIHAKFKAREKVEGSQLLKLWVEMAKDASDLKNNKDVVTLYRSEIPFVPYVKSEEDLWKERLTKGTVLGSWKFNPAFFPYWEKAKISTTFFAGRVHEQAKALRVSIKSSAGYEQTKVTPVVDGAIQGNAPDHTLEFSIPGLPEGRYEVVGEVLDVDGKVVSMQKREYVRKVYPWEHNTLGKSRKVIEPWTPMEVSGDHVSVYARDHQLDASGFPKHIFARKKDVLSKPIEVRLETKQGQSLVLKGEGGCRFTEKSEDVVRWEAEGRLGSKIKTKMSALAEYDGFTWYELTLNPETAVEVQKGTITIAMPKQQAQLMHFQSCWARNNFSGAVPSGDGVVFKSLDTVNYGRKGAFSPHVWFGNPDRGLSWFADSDEGWSSTADVSALEVVRDGDQVKLVLNVIARPVTMKEPRTIRFGLMATPIKPLIPIKDIRTRAVNWLSIKDSKTMVQDHMYALYPPEFDYEKFDQHIPNCRMYFNKHEMGAALPELEVFGNEWGGMEPAPDYPGAPERFGPGIKSRCVNRSLTDSRIDMLVYYIAEMAKKTSMAATYWDITGIGVGLPMLENGTAYKDPESGMIVPTFDILKSRQLFKRVATMWQEIKGEPDYMMIHTTNHIGMPFYGFAYSWLNFEWLWPNEKAKRPDGRWQDFIDLRPLDLFATEGSPAQFGVWINSINHGYRPDEPAEHRRVERSGRALGILHNHSASGMSGSGLKAPPSIGRRDEISFVGYWNEDGQIKSSHEKVKASYWHHDSALELAVVNLDMQEEWVTLSIPMAHLGFSQIESMVDVTIEPEVDKMRKMYKYRSSPEQLKALDELLAEKAKNRSVPEWHLKSGVLKIRLNVESHDYRLIKVLAK